jgi:hypothetical protein
MKKVYFLSAVLLAGLFLASCERSPRLNTEADILGVILPEDLQVGKPEISNTTVRIPKLAVTPEDSERLDAQLKSLTLRFVLSPGARISPDGVARDFSTPQTYTVRSEDGLWTKDYEVSFFTAQGLSSFHLYADTVTTAGKQYHRFYELSEDGEDRLYLWASGNSAYMLMAPVSAAPEAYPTHASPHEGAGAAARLVTCSTGALGALVKIPIAAGNLFLGTFDAAKALTNPLEATQFGIPTTQALPTALRFRAKYRPGDTYKSRDGQVLPLIDRPDIYAVLYEAQTDDAGFPVKLNGNNVKDAPNIIAIAEADSTQLSRLRVNNIEADDYRTLDVPFQIRGTFDPVKQYAGRYYITVVFSSSRRGNLFEGAEGSTLCIDDIRLIDERDEAQ